MTADLDSLLEQTAGGDQQAFKLVYDDIAPKVLAFLMKMLKDRHSAEDVLQEAMVQVWRKAAEYDASKAKASTWIIAIARHRALDLLRKNNRFSQLVRDDQHQISEVLYPEEITAGSDTLSSLTNSRLGYCLGKLGLDPMACIQLAYINGLSLREIAHTRQQSINTVKSWVRRGLKKLAECMQQ